MTAPLARSLYEGKYGTTPSHHFLHSFVISDLLIRFNQASDSWEQ